MNHTFDQLDAHLMNHTLKEIHYKQGTKFDVFSDIQFQREILEAHNEIRAKNGCQGLTWSQELGDQAQHWAEKLAEKGITLFSELTGIGENITFFTIKDTAHLPSGHDVVKCWAEEAKNFNYKNPRWQLDTKNFTQLIWKSCKEMGAGRALTPNNGRLVVVAFYRPTGNHNFPGEFGRNVPKV